MSGAVCCVNPHVSLGLFQLRFVLCNPHLLFHPGLRGEAFLVHVDLIYRLPRLPCSPSFFVQMISVRLVSIWAEGTSP